MGFYGEQVLPRLTDKLLGVREFAKIRREVCADLGGDVIEIGFGSGLSVPFLADAVTGLWAVEPSALAHRLAAKRVAASRVPVHEAGLDGAHIEAPDARFDAALSVMTLCTIPDVTTALRELRRVLKPGRGSTSPSTGAHRTSAWRAARTGATASRTASPVAAT